MYDLIQIGYVALINAVAKYRVGSHTFTSYAGNSIKNAFKYATRQNAKYTSNVRLYNPVTPEFCYSSEYVECIDSLINIEEDLLKAERAKELRHAVAKLPPAEMELIIMIYYSGCPMKTYAEKKGLTYLQASRRRKTALEKLNCCLNK